MKQAYVIGLLCGILVSSCSSLPSVTYAEYRTAPTKAADINTAAPAYQLWTTSLEFKKVAGGVVAVTAQAAPVSSNPFTFSIVGDSHWYGTSTSISLTTANDSELLSSVSVNVTDNRSTYIGIAAEVLGVVAKVGGIALLDANSPPSAVGCHANSIPVAQSPDTAFDEMFNILDAVTALDSETPDCSESNQTVAFVVSNVADGVGPIALIQLDPPPATAIPLTEANIALLAANAKNVFLYPACRIGTVKFNTQAPTPKQLAGGPMPAVPKPVGQSVHFLFSDPRFVQAIAMPVKGTLTVKSQCGMTEGADSGAADATPAVVKALADALQTLAGNSSSSSSSPTKTNATGK
jgi:hypothetical protein